MVQAANNAHLQQMTAGEKVVPGDSNHVTHHMTVGVMGVSKQNVPTKGRPNTGQATERNAAAECRRPGVTCFA